MTWLLTTVVKIFCWVIAHLPRSVQVFIGRNLGGVWFYLVPIRREVALANLALAFPEMTEKQRWNIACENYKNYGCGFLELLMLPYFDEALFKKLIVMHGFENYHNAVKKGKGVFFLTLHMGSWELMSASQGHAKIPLHVISKKFKSPRFNKIWLDLRLDQGIHIIDEEKSTFQILRAIRKGEVVGFILDQFLGPPVRDQN